MVLMTMTLPQRKESSEWFSLALRGDKESEKQGEVERQKA
jgi:hypothetical protein